MPVRPLCLFALLTAASPSAAQVIAAPERIVVGDPVPVRIRGLPAHAEVEVSVEQGGLTPLRSSARFRVDRTGTVDPSRDAPINGDYASRDAAGLFWSMHRDETPDARLPANVLRIAVSHGHERLASRDVGVLAAEPGLTVTPVPGFAGATLHRRGDGRLPVVILLGGSEGGDSFGRGLVPFVTRAGYAALVLPYYAPPWIAEPTMKGLPTAFADIPVDRLAALRDWIAAQRGLDADRVAVVGASKGAEFAMIAAAYYPWLRAVVGIVPSDVVWEGWGSGVAEEGTRSSFGWQGRALPFVPYTGMAVALAAMGRGEPAGLAAVHAAGRRDHPAAAVAAAIPVEGYRGPMLVVGGGRDQVWPSADMASRIAARRRAAGVKTELLVFPDAGHNLAGSGWQPLNAWGLDPTAPATAHAQAITRQHLGRFLAKAFRHGAGHRSRS